MKKKSSIDGLIRGRGRFMLNQTPKVFADKRTKRARSRAEIKRQAIDEGEK